LFIEDPVKMGYIHHNQIFKFVDNYHKFSNVNNKKLQDSIEHAISLLPLSERRRMDRKIDSSEEVSV